MEVKKGGGSDSEEMDEGEEGVILVVEGEVRVKVEGKKKRMEEGGYEYMKKKRGWRMRNEGEKKERLKWIRKEYEYVEGMDVKEKILIKEKEIEK